VYVCAWTFVSTVCYMSIQLAGPLILDYQKRSGVHFDPFYSLRASAGF
jgi:hypothetical protein